jgi:DNA polymerase-3 subunit beta
MKACVSQSDLSQALKALVRIIPKKCKAPILTNLLLTADKSKGVLSISAVHLESDPDNRDVGVSISISASVESSGSTTAPAILLNDVVKTAPKSSVIALQFDDGNQKLEVSSGASKVKIGTMPSEEFPTLFYKDSSPEFEFGVSSSTFIEMVKGTMFAASKDTVKRCLNGVNFQVSGNTLTVAACDGHRLSFESRDDVVDTDESAVDLTVPLKVITELTKVIGKKFQSPSVFFFKGEDSFRIVYGSYTIQFSKMKDTYPNYRQLTPDKFLRVAKVDRIVLLSSLERASKVVNPYNNVVRLDFSDSGTLTISTKVEDEMTYEEEVPAPIEGEGVHIGFNVRYLLDALNVIEGDKVEVKMNASYNPAILSPITESGPSPQTLLIMPVQVRSW